MAWRALYLFAAARAKQEPRQPPRFRSDSGYERPVVVASHAAVVSTACLETLFDLETRYGRPWCDKNKVMN